MPSTVAYYFTISTIGTGQLLGHALVCPAARYVAVRWPQGERLDRRVVAAGDWPAIEQAVRVGSDAHPIDPASSLAQAICPTSVTGRASIRLVEQIAIEDSNIPRVLDASLRSRTFKTA